MPVVAVVAYLAIVLLLMQGDLAVVVLVVAIKSLQPLGLMAWVVVVVGERSRRHHQTPPLPVQKAAPASSS
jgi:hypothetical protein